MLHIPIFCEGKLTHIEVIRTRLDHKSAQIELVGRNFVANLGDTTASKPLRSTLKATSEA